MLSPSSQRVPMHTDPQVQQRINRQTEMNIAYFAAHPQHIDDRIGQLNAEWDVERCLETGASGLTLFSLAMGLLGRRRWFLVAAAVPAFLLQHAIQGWCPPLAMLRRLGVRTRYEIDQERYALKALRGDFREVTADDSNRAFEVVR